jgi:hypothetical protein
VKFGNQELWINTVELKISKRSKESLHYRIVVQGELNDSWSEWLGDVSFESINRIYGSGQTKILSEIPDQAALRGLLNKIWDLNLTLISVNRREKTSTGEINEY